MFPLRDNIPARTTPVVNWALIAACALAFAAQLMTGEAGGSLVERFGMIPARVFEPDGVIRILDYQLVETLRGTVLREVSREAAPAGVPAWLTLLTCIFLHGGWLHFLGNMWFLFIFGDNVEDRLGHARYLLFYLGCGAAASVTHLLTAMDSTVPTIGASGAIAGVMGAYMYLYPRAKVLTLVPIFIFIDIWVVPAVVFLGIWFALQLVQGAASFGSQGGGVAWWAHIGGFAVGLGVAVLMGRQQTLRPRVELVRPNTERPGRYTRLDLRRRPGRWR
ncbi:MAG: rhomboid family intramembrane serine protease [Planctomycetota bacterium]